MRRRVGTLGSIVGIACVALAAACTRSTVNVAQKDPTPSVDAGAKDTAPVEEIYAAADIAQEFEKDYDAAWAKWGWVEAADGGTIARHAPFLVSGRLLRLDELMSGPDKITFGDPKRGTASCYVMYITPEMKRWPRDKIIVVRTRYAGATVGESPVDIDVECDFVELGAR